MSDTPDKGDIARLIASGAKWPYDAPDAWWDADPAEPPPMPRDWAHAAARGILASLTDRRGIKHELDAVDEDVRAEMVETFAAVIREATRRALAGETPP